MGKLEKLGRSILKKLGAGTNRRRRAAATSSGDVINATSSSSSSSSSSDDDSLTLTPPAGRSSTAEMSSGYIHQFRVVPPDDTETSCSPTSPEAEEVRSESPAASDEGSAGYATDDTALSSLSPLDVKRTSVDYSESQGYYSTAELSPREDPKTPPIPRIVLEEEEAPLPVAQRVPLYKKVSQEYPRINVRHQYLKKDEPMYKSSQALAQATLEVPKISGRSATLSNLTSEPEDPIERFLKSSIYKTKMITTVFEAKDGGFELLITATNSEDESLTSSAILKVNVENLEDNEPRFLQGLSPVFQIDRNVSKPTAIGRLTAFDPDHKPIFYHLLPTCGSEMSANFTIDPEFGEVVYHPKKVLGDEQKIELCFLATSQTEKDVSEVFFDATADNMLKVIVYFVDDVTRDQEDVKKMHISGNQSISRVGDGLDRVEIPISLNEAPSLEFSLKSLQFVPANYELGRDMISPEGSVELNKKTGELVANGRILDTPQGVYTARIEQGAGNEAVKQLHHIRNDRKLRYVLAMSRDEFGANSEKLRRQILEAIGEKEKDNGKHLEVFFDEPTMDKKNSTWTSVCFYLTRDNAILDEKQMTSLVSASNGHIAKLHHIFKVVNIDVCAARRASGEAATSSSANPSEIPLNTLILIAVVGLLIVALVALLVFVCCVSRYQRYLKQKAERMRCNSSAGSYYKSPNLIPPPPGYIHTPPLPPPPPPAAIAFY